VDELSEISRQKVLAKVDVQVLVLGGESVLIEALLET
jgi:hypothetical protein